MARRFVTGSSQYFANTGGSPVSTYPFSISACYTPAATLQDKAIFCLANGSDRHLLYQNQDSVAMFSANAGASDQARASSGTAASGVLVRVGGVVASAVSRKIYINGALDTSNTTSVSTGALAQTYLGAYYSSGLVGGFYANGDIAEVGIWDVELTAEEWSALGAGCSPLLIRPQNLRAYWPLLGRATDEEDWVGALPLTNTNGAAVAAHPRIIEPWQRLTLISSAAPGILFDAASNSGYQVAQTSYTFNRTVTGANTFLAVDVEILSVPGTTVTGVTDDGVAMTFIGAKSTVSGAGRVECWGIVNPTAGTKTISVTLSASVNSAATAASYTGVNQIVPTEAFNSAQATNVGAADATVSITSVADNCWVHGACATDDGSITAVQTSRNNVSGAAGSGADEDNNGPVTPPGATMMSYTGIGALATWAIAGYAIRPVAASSPATGTLAATLANASMASAGAVTDVGTFASTLGNVAMTAAGTVTNAGVFASTLGNVTMAASGEVAGNITGTIAATLADATMSASGISGNPSTSTNRIITRKRLRGRSRPTFGA